MPRRQRRRIPSSNPSRASDQTDPFIYLISRQTSHGTQRAISDLASGDMPRPKKNKPEMEQQRNQWLSNPRHIAPKAMADPLGTTASSSQTESSSQGYKKTRDRENIRGYCTLQWKEHDLDLPAAIKNQKGMSIIDIKDVYARRLGCDVKLFPKKKYRYNAGSLGSWKAIGETEILIKNLDGKFKGMTVMVWEDNVPFHLVIHKSQASMILHPGECPGYPSTSVQETTVIMPGISDIDAGQGGGIHGPGTDTLVPHLNEIGPMPTDTSCMADQPTFHGHTPNEPTEIVAEGRYRSGDAAGPPQTQAIVLQDTGEFDWLFDSLEDPTELFNMGRTNDNPTWQDSPPLFTQFDQSNYSWFNESAAGGHQLGSQQGEQADVIRDHLIGDASQVASSPRDGPPGDNMD